LLRRGHEVLLFCNYPAFAVARFGVPRTRVHSFWPHGVASRLLRRLFPGGLDGRVDRWLNQCFGQWAARLVRRHSWDVVLAFSGAAEEVFRGLAGTRTLRVLHRGSAHIGIQRQILQQERARTGVPVEMPSDWIVGRETREYAQADLIHILSSFAEK